MVLKEIAVPLWPHKECEVALRTSFGAQFTLPPTAVCAGAKNRDACDVSMVYMFVSGNRKYDIKPWIG